MLINTCEYTKSLLGLIQVFTPTHRHMNSLDVGVAITPSPFLRVTATAAVPLLVRWLKRCPVPWDGTIPTLPAYCWMLAAPSAPWQTALYGLGKGQGVPGTLSSGTDSSVVAAFFSLSLPTSHMTLFPHVSFKIDLFCSVCNFLVNV